MWVETHLASKIEELSLALNSSYIFADKPLRKSLPGIYAAHYVYMEMFDFSLLSLESITKCSRAKLFPLLSPQILFLGDHVMYCFI